MPIAAIMAAAEVDEGDLLQRLSRSAKRTRDMFLGDFGSLVADDMARCVHAWRECGDGLTGATIAAFCSQRLKLTTKIIEEYAHVRELPAALRGGARGTAAAAAAAPPAAPETSISGMIDRLPITQSGSVSASSASASGALVLAATTPASAASSKALATYGVSASAGSQAVVRNPHAHKVPKPKWHPPWKLMRVRALDRAFSLACSLSSA